VRALAFLLVFANHYLLLPWGFVGVDIFFALSGFLITGILCDTRNAAHRVWNFYVRRTLRIFPLYYGVFIVVAILYPIFHWQPRRVMLIWPLYIGNLACNFFHPHYPSRLAMMIAAQPWSRSYPNISLIFGHFWSLCVEEQFYLFWPAVVFWIKDRRLLIYICAAVVVASPILRIAGQHFLPSYMVGPFPSVLYYATPFRLDSLLIGGLVALLQRGRYASTMLKLARVAFVILGFAAAAWFAKVAVSGSGNYYPAWAETRGFSYVVILSACLIVMTLQHGSIAFRLFRLEPMRWLGRITYGAYVFFDIPHVLYKKTALHFGGGMWATAALALVCTILMAWTSFVSFESKFIRLKDRFTIPRDRQPVI